MSNQNYVELFTFNLDHFNSSDVLTIINPQVYGNATLFQRTTDN
jgi:hypothetical protein